MVHAVATRDMPAGELHAWLVPLDDDSVDEAEWYDVLDPVERARARRYAFALLRRRYVAAHAALRGVLGHVLGMAPERVAIVTGADGKPGLGAGLPPLHFNLSHSGGMAVVALSGEGSVGVDVEYCAPQPRLPLLVARYFSVLEQEAFWRLDDAQRLPGFYRWWTCKEACLKATGHGLRYPLDGFSVEFRPGFAPRVLQAEDALAGLRLAPLVFEEPGWCGTVALASRNTPNTPLPRMRRWSWHGWRM